MNIKNASPCCQPADVRQVSSAWCFDKTFVGSELCVRATLAELRAHLESNDLEGSLIGRMEMVLAELFNNICEHAYAMSGTGVVNLSISFSDSLILAEVRDEGNPMPGGSLPKGTLPDLDVSFADLPEGGFGWHIIRTQSDEVTYARQHTCNVTRLTFDPSRDSDI